MNDLALRIVNAIFRQEGMGPTHANPGNLRDCPWFPVLEHPPFVGQPKQIQRYYPDTGKPVSFSGGFWVPRTRMEGEAGALHVVCLHIAEGNNLRTLLSIWAPETDDNNTNQYIQNVSEWAGIPDPEAQLWNYLT